MSLKVCLAPYAIQTLISSASIITGHGAGEAITFLDFKFRYRVHFRCEVHQASFTLGTGINYPKVERTHLETGHLFLLCRIYECIELHFMSPMCEN